MADIFPPITKADDECVNGFCPMPTRPTTIHSVPDAVINPSHYKGDGGVECIDAMKSCSTYEEFCGYLKNSAMKYLFRLNSKATPLENATKASWFLARLIKELSDGPPLPTKQGGSLQQVKPVRGSIGESPGSPSSIEAQAVTHHGGRNWRNVQHG